MWSQMNPMGTTTTPLKRRGRLRSLEEVVNIGLKPAGSGARRAIHEVVAQIRVRGRAATRA